MKPTFRNNTWDRDIWECIVNKNEYSIIDDWHGTVIDIGGHIGSFSYFMLVHKKAHKIIAIEPDPTNFSLLQHNLQPFINNNQAIVIHAGIGNPGSKLCIEQPLENMANTGGVSYKISENGTIDSISLDSLIQMAGNEPILLKLDCEGCEYEALASCDNLHRISAIVGEYHVRGDNSYSFLQNILQSNNFEFNHHPTYTDLGLFAAHQKH